jgi:hypothetical protein
MKSHKWAAMYNMPKVYRHLFLLLGAEPRVATLERFVILYFWLRLSSLWLYTQINMIRARSTVLHIDQTRFNLRF